jgi:hypothetical protein
VIPPAIVKQDVFHSDISEAENCMTNAPIIPGAPMPVSLKIKASPAKKRKESSRIQGPENKENKPAKGAQNSLVPVADKDVSDSDDDLVPQLLQNKRP